MKKKKVNKEGFSAREHIAGKRLCGLGEGILSKRCRPSTERTESKNGGGAGGEQALQQSIREEETANKGTDRAWDSPSSRRKSHRSFSFFPVQSTTNIESESVPVKTQNLAASFCGVLQAPPLAALADFF